MGCARGFGLVDGLSIKMYIRLAKQNRVWGILLVLVINIDYII